MLYKIISSILFLSLFFKNLSAQEPSKEAKRQFALNSYIDYLNLSSDNLFRIYHDVQDAYIKVKEHFNGKIELWGDNEIYPISLTLMWGIRENNFLKNDYKKYISDYDTWGNFTNRIFDSVSSSFNTFLDQKQKQIIFSQLQQLHIIYLNINKKYKMLNGYLTKRNNAYLKSANSISILYDSVNTFKCFDSIALYFKDFKLKKDALEKNIIALQEYDVPETWKMSGFYKIAQASKPLINLINTLCNKTYYGDTIGLQKNIEELKKLKIALIESANPILDTMFTFSKTAGNDPRFRFNSYISCIDAFTFNLKRMQEDNSRFYKSYGKNNIAGYYNVHIIWAAINFERAFNNFIDLANGKKRLDEALCCYADNPRLDKTVYILPKITFVPARFDTHSSLKEDTSSINNIKIPTDTIQKLISTSAFSHLVLLLDVSSSMKAPDRLDILKNALDFIINYLRKEDKISIVLFSGTANVVIENVSGVDKQTLTKTIDQLQSHGSTNADAGIKMAYEIAKKYFIANGNNRIIVGTDGDFSLNNQSKNIIKEAASTGIALSCLLLGKDANASIIDFLEQISEKGNGHFYKVDSTNAKDVLLKEVTAIKLN